MEMVKIKNILLGLTLAGLIVSNIFSFTNAFSDNNEFHNATQKTLDQHEKRIEICEEALSNNYELLQEIRFNLRNHIELQGGVYINGAK